MTTIERSTWATKVGLARMLAGGVIMDVVTADQARIAEEAGAAMIRTKGEAGTGDIVEAVRHMRAVQKGIRQLQTMRPDELFAAAKELRAPYDVVKATAEAGALPVPNFSAGGGGGPGPAPPI